MEFKDKKRQKVEDEKVSEKLEMYKILYQAYADEIKNLWQRSAFLAVFMTLAWGGYGALQMRFMEKFCEANFYANAYNLASFGLCGVIIVLSLLWVAKGSKFVQEAHEDKIKHFNFSNFKNLNALFCDLDEYEFKNNEHKITKEKVINKDLKDNLLVGGELLKAYRYSPSKINIFLGKFSCVLAIVLFLWHIAYLAFNAKLYSIVVILFVVSLEIIVLTFLSVCYFRNDLKGGKMKNQNLNKGAKNG